MDNRSKVMGGSVCRERRRGEDRKVRMMLENWASH